MKRSASSLHAVRAAALVLALSSLAGCDTLNDWFSSDKVDYKSTRSAPALNVPGDLSAVAGKPQYTAPPANLALGGAPDRNKTSAGNLSEGVPSAQDPLGMHIERDGDRRWLVVDGRSPDQLWPQLQEFWQENGFSLKTNAPATGIMATDWAENRASIPDDWFRRTIGRVIDFAYSSGTRDRFVTLVERGPNGATDISITHSALEEVLTGQDKDSSRWVERPRNPVLEAVFLSKLMQKFGLTEAQSKDLISSARPGTPPAKIDMAGGETTLDLQESFDRAWLRVGLALDRTNFAVDNRDRTKGIYYVRYADSMQELKGEGLLGKLFTRKSSERKAGQEFLVNVRASGENRTQVAILDAQGQIDKSAEAKQILSLLHAQLR
ncbi:outer membrane protein assembly factor BamC [Trinickia caryophylli]|uniref:Beta-barrel assembly machine subunit BamC n=1 Tax=Trinickia caryophylli TaxID=28094 RepID=A0A1X7DGP7_TRICW|nr:outer membrane protein assembly factor BamC [Trinickia caryophylli]PMS08660.1 outer membrane protein assembly factor BamC [Trinickia caryophylli]TRX16933.1 outer membrane protein assembly factor BamC [Trinickia caryophylli]WQE12336.1 outer membrane protein assembly factor BamC [Trinickia caryophylli]SMF14970.1 Beta-barrel assembly machine subunit BamC [Trinickia caryophylli]GLU31517.1 lipoprotein [Trinickia caryophylli]